MSENEMAISPEMLNDFLEESLELIQEAANLLVDFEQDPQNMDLINNMFRNIHSIKGSAAFFQLNRLAELSHIIENVMDLLRKKSMAPNETIISTLILGLEELQSICNRKTQGLGEIENESSFEAVLAKFKGLTQQKRSLSTEVSLFVNAFHSFAQELNEEAKNTTVYRAVDDALQRVENIISTTSTARPFRKNADYYYNGRDVSGEISTIKDIISKHLEPPFPVTLAQRLADAFHSLIKSMDGEGLKLLKQMLFLMEMVLSEIEPMTEEVMLQTSKDFELLMQYISQPNKIEVEAPEPKKPPIVNPGQELKAVVKNEISENENPTQKVEAKTMRVSEEKVDDFMHFVGELVVVGDMLQYIANEAPQSNIKEALEERIKLAHQTFYSLSQSLIDGILEIRKIPLEGLLKKVPIMTRSMAAKLGKKVHVELEGQDISIDKSIFEMLDHPLTHLIRNSMDHGIETPEIRRERGKSETGLLVVKAEQLDSWIHLTIKDDGGGVSHSRVRAKAVEKGLLSEDEARRLSNDEAVQLIFLPGFSTAESVSDISGRGVGMDAVKTSIESFNGKIEVYSTEGEGSVTLIKLPVTTSFVVVEGVTVEINDKEFIIPLEYMRNAFRPQVDDVFWGDGQELVKHHDQIIPLVRLGDVLGVSPRVQNISEAILVVVEYRKQALALMVDGILGQTQVVIRQLGIREMHGPLAHKSILGGAVMGDSHIALVLDLKHLFAKGHRIN